MFAINKALLPLKTHYFLSSGTDCLRKMIPLILREKGIPTEAVGMMYSAMTLFGLLITFAGGTVADYFKVHRTMLIMILLVATIGTNSIYFLPNLPGTDPVKLYIEEAEIVERAQVHSLNEVIELEGTGLLESSRINLDSYVLKETSKFDLAELLMTPEFIFLFLAYVTEQSSQGLVYSLTDTVVFQVLDGETTRYGQQKMFGEIGIMTNAALIGYLVDWYSTGLPQRDYLPAFAICVAFIVLDVSVLSKLKLPETPKVEETEDKKAKKISDLFNFKFVLYLFSVFIFGFAMNFMWIFKPLVAEEIANMYDPNFSQHKFLQGFMISMQCLSGSVFYGISGHLIRWLGHTRVFIIGFCFIGLHFVLFYFISNPWFILPLELLNGPSYILLRATVASYGAKIAPPGALARLQAASQTTFFLGYGIAGFAGSLIYNKCGCLLTFMLIGCFMFTFTIFYSICKTILKLKDILASRDIPTQADLEADKVCNIYSTPPRTGKSGYNPDDSFMDNFKEIIYTPKPKTSQIFSPLSFDSGVDLLDKSPMHNGVHLRSSTPRKSASKTPNHCSMAVDMDVDTLKHGSSSSKTTKLTILDSIKAGILSPKKVVNTSSRCKRKLPLWDCPGLSTHKLD